MIRILGGKSHATAVYNGMTTARKDRPLSDNPYGVGSQAYHVYRDAWLLTQSERNGKCLAQRAWSYGRS